LERGTTKMIERNFVSLGEKTYYKVDQYSLQVIQKIKILDLVICILVGVLFYKILLVSFPLIFIGLFGFFVLKKLEFDKKKGILRKDIYFFRYRIFNLYKLTSLSEYSLSDYKTDNDQDKRSDLFEISLIKNEKPYLLMSFYRQVTRDKLFSILAEFLS